MAKDLIRITRPSLEYAFIGILLGIGAEKKVRGGWLSLLLRPLSAWFYITNEGLVFSKSKLEFRITNFTEPSSIWSYFGSGWKETQWLSADQLRFEQEPGLLWTKLFVYNQGDPDRNIIIVAPDRRIAGKIRKWRGKTQKIAKDDSFVSRVKEEADFLDAVEEERNRRAKARSPTTSE